MLPDGCKLTVNRKERQWRYNLPTWRHRQIFSCCCVSRVILVTGPSFLPILWLILELWQFSFIMDWPEIWKSEPFLSMFCLMSGHWGKLGIPNLALMYLIKCYWLLQDSTFTTFTNSELLRENQPRVGGKSPPLPPSPKITAKIVKTVYEKYQKFQIYFLKNLVKKT